MAQINSIFRPGEWDHLSAEEKRFVDAVSMNPLQLNIEKGKACEVYVDQWRASKQ